MTTQTVAPVPPLVSLSPLKSSSRDGLRARGKLHRKTRATFVVVSVTRKDFF